MVFFHKLIDFVIPNLVGGQYLHVVMILLALFALLITLGGMKVIGYTDVIQVAVLIIGGLATTYMALLIVSEKFGLGRNVLAGFNTLLKEAPDHFHMILQKPGPGATQEQINKYLVLPGIAMYFAGQWIVNLNYWGCNQYITQRALGANLQTARTGILFAGIMKLTMPVIVMLPGIAAYVLYKNGHLPQLSGGSKDGAYSAIPINCSAEMLEAISDAPIAHQVSEPCARKKSLVSAVAFFLRWYIQYPYPATRIK